MNSGNASPWQVPAHGGQLRAISLRFGIPADDILDFSVNINPDGPPPAVLPALRRALEDPHSLTSYPDLEYKTLKLAIGSHSGVPMHSITVGNGFVSLLQAALSALRVRSCLLPVPAFSEYRASLHQAGVETIPFPLEPARFQYDAGALLHALHARSSAVTPRAILLANPQNPSGALAPASLLLELVHRAADLGITILLDEAFIDYATSESLTREAPSLPNLIVFRSVTKFYSVPSLRAAYAISSPPHADAMAQALAPWSISTLAAEGITAALAEPVFEQSSRERNAARRLHLEALLAGSGVETYPSAANFLLLKLPGHLRGESIWTDLVIHERLLTRSCTNFEGLSPPHLRVSIRASPDNERLVAALGRVLARGSS